MLRRRTEVLRAMERQSKSKEVGVGSENRLKVCWSWSEIWLSEESISKFMKVNLKIELESRAD